MGLLVALHRIGPYHHARFQYAAHEQKLHVLETRPQSQEYPWAFTPGSDYTIHRLSGHPNPEADPPIGDLDRQLVAVLAKARPRVVVSVGWADPAYQRLLLICHRQRIPLVIVSDSRERVEPRCAVKEWMKQQLLRGYSAAVVAGTESRAYLEQLGLSPEAITQPWDVVDNQLFSSAAAAAAAESSKSDPEEFLCVSRFIAVKNHLGLLRAYGLYQQAGGRWNLRLVGSGPEEAAIRAGVSELPKPERVSLEPFRQLNALTDVYGKASAFVLASISDTWGLVVNEAMAAGLPVLVSSACGCTVDLIDHGSTGFCFDPLDPRTLAQLMHRIEAQSAQERLTMVVAARRRLESFSLASFSQALQDAAAYASANPAFSWRSRCIAQLLSHRLQ
ncbi:glycosyltransferase family 4 protein [Synechococcus sp. CCFWC 502]|nr:glycosyltransferase family 4 protein [Synechococcus sp. CCFWC 502]WFN58666.1 glycosyltransferase family 4 protein [Synechococcus sp. CCFWC 502]